MEFVHLKSIFCNVSEASPVAIAAQFPDTGLGREVRMSGRDIGFIVTDTGIIRESALQHLKKGRMLV